MSPLSAAILPVCLNVAVYRGQMYRRKGPSNVSNVYDAHLPFWNNLLVMKELHIIIIRTIINMSIKLPPCSALL